MDNIPLSHEVKDFLCACSEGNPGALVFMTDAFMKDAYTASVAFGRMLKCGITGSKLYMLWNDCCNRDTLAALFIMNNLSPIEIKQHLPEGRGIPFSQEVYDRFSEIRYD